MINLLICALFGYLVGTVNPSYLIARRRGFDIRQAGSGNAGGSNAVITMGKKTGALCCAFDFAKAYLVVKMMTWMFPLVKLSFIVTGASCILGHIFPFYMKFKGGKGLACLGGVVLAYNPLVFTVLLFSEIVFVLLVDYICFVSMTGSAVFSVVYGFMNHDLIGALLFVGITLIICWRHKDNIRRIANGTELRLSFMWKHDEEKERVEKNLGGEITHLN